MPRASKNAAITFDLWQTLIFEFEGSVKSGRRRTLRAEYAKSELSRLGESICLASIDRHLSALSAEITAGHDRGFDSHYDVWVAKLMERITPGLENRVGSETVKAIGRAMDRTFIESPPQLLEGVPELLDSLSARGLKIGLVSNTGLTSPATYKEWFSQINLLDRFEYIAFSNDLAIAKPTRQIFDLTLAALGVPPEQTLHVGDNLHTDVAGAAAVGMSTVWVRGGVESTVDTSHEPDYTVDSVVELAPVVDKWLNTLDG